MCGDPQPDDGSACPRDGSTLFNTNLLATDEVAAPASVIGMQLGDYEVQHAIGDGGMGIVYRGLQPVIQKKVAIKVLRPDVANDKSLVKRFLAEAQAVNAINHRNIVDIFTLGTLPDGRPYIVMEFLDGIPLDKFLRQNAPLAPAQVVDLLLEILSPLSAAHAAGIVHRDLKPSNVFVVSQADGTRYLKLLDFGLAKWSFDRHSAQTSGMMVTGTPDYMAPEQARGLEATFKADLYALGVMAFEMITGRVPFRGATPMDVMMQHVQTPPPPLGDCPQALETVILSLLAKDPDQRPASGEAIRDALKQAQGQLGTARAKPTLGVAAPSGAARWALPGLAAALVLTGAVGVGFLLLRGKPAETAAVVEPPPPIGEAPDMVPPLPEDLEPAAPHEPAATPATPAGTRPTRPTRAGHSSADPAGDALAARLDKLEARLRRSVDPGEEPDPSAVVLLKRLRVQVATSRSIEERKSVTRSIDEWETTFLKRH